MTEWQLIEGYETKYKINKNGKILNIQTNKFLNPWKNNQGYYIVRLTDLKNGKREQKRLHVLLAKTFIPNPNCLPVVNHIDHNPSNNNLINLEWCTQKQNLNHARKHNRMYKHPKGERSKNRKLNQNIADQIRIKYKTGKYSWSKLAKQFNTNKRTVGRIINNEYYVA